jgi:hypothetical protein
MENADTVKRHQEKDTEAHGIRRQDAIYKRTEQNRNSKEHREKCMKYSEKKNRIGIRRHIEKDVRMKRMKKKGTETG